MAKVKRTGAVFSVQNWQDWALKYVQHEWLKCTARKGSKPEAVDILIEQIKALSPALLKVIVNITDQNGNTALHYAVSHGNFGVVSSLLDSGECQLNLANRAGYSAVMLAALSSLENEVEKAVVQRLFELGDVNARAQQHGQTALMLSVSHGKKATTDLLLACGADVNLQDEEGSTALMCAAEHGHKDIVKLLLGQPGIDAALTDCDSSTALSIAVENGHRDIGVLIYAHLNYSRAEAIEESC
ncbi:ankyrin repeat protein [Teladorsagia circumcincta]|uniref:Ankyrin repeat protein n=1 Tax=Teladorsagia circumcincta TaxID=45464 RepID=A0A2G9TL30_TELCI|nr:ankyrin repeat protein [Teladorsagia circumcincta]